jgi:hypothetical protein
MFKQLCANLVLGAVLWLWGVVFYQSTQLNLVFLSNLAFGWVGVYLLGYLAFGLFWIFCLCALWHKKKVSGKQTLALWSVLQSLSLGIFVYPQVSTFWISLVALLFSSAFVYFVRPLCTRDRILALILLYVTLSIPFEPLIAKRVYALPGNYKVYPASEGSLDSLISSGPKWQRLLTEDSTQQVYAVFAPDYALERLAMQCASRMVEVTATKDRPIRLWSDFTLRIQGMVPECRLKDMEALYAPIDSLMGIVY